MAITRGTRSRKISIQKSRPVNIRRLQERKITPRLRTRPRITTQRTFTFLGNPDTRPSNQRIIPAWPVVNRSTICGKLVTAEPQLYTCTVAGIAGFPDNLSRDSTGPSSKSIYRHTGELYAHSSPVLALGATCLLQSRQNPLPVRRSPAGAFLESRPRPGQAQSPRPAECAVRKLPHREWMASDQSRSRVRPQ